MCHPFTSGLDMDQEVMAVSIGFKLYSVYNNPHICAILQNTELLGLNKFVQTGIPMALCCGHYSCW